MNPQKKHTLPEGWEMKKLGNLALKVGSGITPKGGRETYLSSGIPIVRSQNVVDGRLILDEVAFISEKQHQKMKATHLRADDLLLNITGASIGRTCVVPSDFKEGNVNQHVCIIRLDSAKSDSNFVNAFLSCESGQKLIDSYQVGGGRQGLNFEQIKSFPIPLPPLPEQRRIAAVLGTWDTAIEQTTELLNALRARHRGLMHQLLTGKVRLPGFGGEWKRVVLSDLFERVNRRNTEGNTNVLTISAQQGLVGQGRYFNKNVASENLANYFLLYRGEFAYNKSYSAGYPMGAIKRLDQYDRGVLSPLYICFRMRNEAENEAKFFTHFFEAGCLNEGIGEIAQEGARNHGLLNVGINDFFSLRIVVPCLAEQRAIAQVLDASLKEIQYWEAKLEAVREQKRGLMQCLLTGQVRVPAEVA